MLFFESFRPGRISELIRLLVEKSLKSSGLRMPPVPNSLVYMLAENTSVEIRHIAMKAYSGAIWKVKGCWIIFLNANDDVRHQRITLFHEAFHMLAHCKGVPVFKKVDRDEGSFNELLGDDFAYQILMPQKWVEREWRRQQDVVVLANMFDVPEDAMQLRLETLHLI